MKILLYQIPFHKVAAILAGAKAIGAEVVYLKDEDLHNSIEFLMDGNRNQNPGKDSQKAVGELMIFGGFSDNDLDEFLAGYHSTNAPAVAAKAMMTPVNQRWSPAYLYAQLLNEIRK